MLKIKHVELRDANMFVLEHHRHHKPVQGHRFSVGVYDNDKLVGVAIVGRPVARGCDARTTVEVTRVCTDGTKNACSILYAACARASKELGYSKIQSYILDSESGTSLRASGWIVDGHVRGRAWIHTDGKERRMDQPLDDKVRYAKYFD